MAGLALLVLAAVPFAASAPAPDATGGGGARCGVERWPVKTLQDGRASEVNFRPQGTTVEALRERPRPLSLGARTRGVETTTYRVRARLVEMKREKDSDVHLVIAALRNRRHTMIVEFPSSGCTRRASTSARRKMAAARRALATACGAAGGSFVRLTGTATVTGVGFFDFEHGQRGVAPNAIELHPVVGFRSSNCRRA